MNLLTLPIEIGKKYIRRDGKIATAKPVVHAINLYDADELALVDENEKAWSWNTVFLSSGRVEVGSGAEYPLDLVADYIEPAKAEPAVGHPHAEAMAQFAEDARTNPEPWRLWEEFVWLFTGDKQIQQWRACMDAPQWHRGIEYRHKPPTPTPDPHAANMAEYAKDAAETDKAWERWEQKMTVSTPWSSDWCSLSSHPLWEKGTEYRRKPSA